MIYRQYTVTSSVKLPLIFKCAKCGKVVISDHVVSSEAAYNDKGAWLNRQLESREESATESAKKRNNKQLEKILIEAEVKRYREAKYTCHCPYCYEKPLWARMAYKWTKPIYKLLTVVVFFAVCFMLLSALESDTNGAQIILKNIILPCLGIASIIKAGVLFHRNSIEKQIEKMDEQYLPFLCLTAEEIVKTKECLEKIQ